VNQRLERHVHVEVLSRLVAHLLHIDLLEQRADVDTLDEHVNLLLQLLVIRLILLVLLDGLRVVPRQHFLLTLQPLPLTLELGKSQLLANDVLSVRRPLCLHLLGTVLDVVQFLLSRDLQIQHVLTLLLFFFELFQHDFRLVCGRLDRMLQPHLHLFLGFGEFGSLIGFSDATSLNLILQL